MAGSVVPLPASHDAGAETKLKRDLLAWADDIADAVIAAALEDAGLQLSGDELDAEELAARDFSGDDYDPIIDPAAATRLSEAIREAADKFRQLEKVLRRLYTSALKRKWREQNKQIPDAPAGALYGVNYMTTRHGVWCKAYVAGSGLYVWRRICRTQIDPHALSRDTTRERNWRHVYTVTDETGQFAVEIKAALLAKEAARAISILMNRGVHVVETKQARQHLANFLRYKPKRRILRAPATGWFESSRGRWVFVLPDQTLGDPGKTAVVLEGGGFGYGLQRRGTSDQWRHEIAQPLAGNSNVVLAVGTFLAGPLLRWAGEPGGGFHFHGPSKIGKTLIGAVAQSIYGRPFMLGAGADTFGFSWEVTAARLGERAVLRNDVGLYLDELGIGDQRAIATAIYQLSGGLGKGRYRQAERDFSVLFMSTGEPALAEFLQGVRPGQLVRLVDVPATVQSDSALETVSKREIAAAGRKYYAATSELHGAVGYDWLCHLVALTPGKISAELRRRREAWLALPAVADITDRAHPQVTSVVNRFALVTAALAMAVDAKILSWSISDIDAAVIACMQRWLNQRGNLDLAGELLREVERRRKLIAATVRDRFIHINVEGRRLVPASAADQHKLEIADQFDGYVKDDRILVGPEAWQRLWGGLDIKAVNEHLLREEFLIPAGDGKAPSVEKVKSGEPAERFYVLAPSFIKFV
jgi:putative DNA primase/helicase